MLATIKGYYEEGKITFAEAPPVKTKTEVIITFLTEEKEEKISGKRILGGLEGKVNLPADFNEPLDELKDYM
jgi:Protein of unknown function (DUF2281)